MTDSPRQKHIRRLTRMATRLEKIKEAAPDMYTDYMEGELQALKYALAAISMVGSKQVQDQGLTRESVMREAAGE